MPTVVLKTRTMVGGVDGAARGGVAPVGVLGMVPRFVLVETSGMRIGARLLTLGWQPHAVAGAVGALSADVIRDAQVLVVGCSERLLLAPAFQTAIERLPRLVPRVAVVDASGAETPSYAARLGWSGFVPAQSSASEIAYVIAAAARGEPAFPDDTLWGLVRTLARLAPVRSTATAALTPRQQQVVTLIAQGATDSDIAAVLCISTSTAHKHVQNARRRLQAKTRGQLVAASRERAAL